MKDLWFSKVLDDLTNFVSNRFKSIDIELTYGLMDVTKSQFNPMS